MMVVIATKSRRLALLCELDISACLLACTVAIIPVSLLHFILYKTGGEGNNKVTSADKKSSAGPSVEHISEFTKGLPVCLTFEEY